MVSNQGHHSHIAFGIMVPKVGRTIDDIVSARADAPSRVRNSFSHSDARCARAAGRRARIGDAPLHSAGSRTSAGFGEAGLGFAPSTTAAHPPIPGPRPRKGTRNEIKNVVETFLILLLQINDFRFPFPST